MKNKKVVCSVDTEFSRVILHKFVLMFLLSIFVLLCLKLVLVAIYLVQPIKIANFTCNDNIFNVAKGDSAATVAHKLEQEGIIPYPIVFRAILFLLHKDSKIHAGEYELTPNLRIYDLINKISSGDVKQYEFRINPNETVSTMLFRLNKEEKLTKLIPYFTKCKIPTVCHPRAGRDPCPGRLNSRLRGNDSVRVNFNNLHCISVNKLEGLFFPDTYYYVSGDSDISILLRANNKLIKYLDDLWVEREDDFNVISSSYEALILASILEKETADIYERYLVSGVIYNRLKVNMILQMDPTVIYALNLGGKYTRNLRKENLSYNSPYNTYKNKGLPPGPIGPASIESLTAATHPIRHDYLYFVATGDGKHSFSKNLTEHNKAVQRYLKTKVKYAS